MCRALSLLCVAAALLGGCSSRAEFRYPGDVDPGDPTPEPPVLDAGDGRDGPLTIDAPLVVNTCASVSSAQDSSVLVAQPFAPPPGTRVLVIQVADEFAMLGDAAAIEQPGAAGRFELARIASFSSGGAAVIVETPLAFEYRSSGAGLSAQVCTIPEATDVTISASGEIRAAAWDGQRGGVAAILATGLVQVDGAIVADGAGFRGGAASNPGGASVVLTLSTVAEDGGGKAEGLDASGWNRFGRGSCATGAGGGNSSRAGGGGGGNGGAGGFGGTDTTASAETQGQAGAALDARIEERMSFGGGGGGGHQVSLGGLRGGAGGAGGGFVLVVAETISGSGTIGANGAAGADGGFVVADGADGAGGGGAGGTILLRSGGSSTFAGTIRAAGANGGDVRLATGALAGPGGGGGGGRILLGNVNATPDVAAGNAGANLDAANDPRGANGGATGVVEED